MTARSRHPNPPPVTASACRMCATDLPRAMAPKRGCGPKGLTAAIAPRSCCRSKPCMAEPPIKVLIVDDEPLAVERLMMLCAGLDGITVIGSAGDGEAALDMLDRCAPDLLLLDIAMPRMDGVSLARHLERRVPRPAVIFVTAYDHYAVDAFDV